MRRMLFFLILLCCILGLTYPAMAKDFIYAPVLNNLQIVDCDTDTVVKTIPYDDYIVNACFSPDGKRYYMNSWRNIYVVDTDRQELIDTYKFFTELTRVTLMIGMTVSQDNNTLYLNTTVAKKKLNVPRLTIVPPQIWAFDVNKKQVVKTWDVPYCATGLFTIRNDPNHLIVWDSDVHKLDLRTGSMEKVMGVLRPEPGQPGLNSLVVWVNNSPGDHGIFVNAAYTAEDLYYVLLDTNTGKMQPLVKGEEVVMIYSGVVSPDKKYIYAGMDEVYKIDAKTGKHLGMSVINQGTCYGFNITSDGKKVYTGPGGADLTVYDTATMKEIGVIPLKGDGLVAHRLTK
jgi:DNA-binding beta-propeller fold protein YncE